MRITWQGRAMGLGLLAVLGLSGCDVLDDITGDGDEDPVLNAIEVTAEDGATALMVNGTLQLTAEAVDQFGDPYDADITWSSGNTAVATVDEYGEVTGTGVGAVVITASAEEVEGTLSLTVAGTLHGGDITASETWTAAGNPHVIASTIYVDGTGGPVLTIEAGVQVRVAADAGLIIGWSDTGGLSAVGTATSPITLQSAEASPTGGNWAGIWFTASTTTAELRYVALEQCGIASGACVMGEGQGTDPVLDHVTIDQSLALSYGVYFSDDASFGAGSADLTITGTTAPVRLEADRVGTLPTGSYQGNTVDKIMVDGGDVTTSQTWGNPEVPYAILSSVFVDGTGAPDLTLAPGVTLLFAADAALHIGWSDGGGLVAEGTPAAPIMLGSNASSPTAGDWYGVVVNEVATSVSLAHVFLRHCGGNSGSYEACLSVYMGDIAVDTVTVDQSQAYGVDMREDGRFSAGSVGLTVSGTQLAPVVMDANYVSTLPEGSYTGNQRNVILIANGDVEQTQTWSDHGVPYVVDNSVWVEGTGTPVLTITEGTTLRFGVDAGLYAGWGQGGEIRALGSDTLPVLFTGDAASPSAGHWLGIALDEWSSASSLFDYVTIEFAGSDAGVWDPAAFVVVDEKGAVLTNSVIQHSGGCGVLRVEANSMPTTDFTAPALNNTFVSNAGGNQCDY